MGAQARLLVGVGAWLGLWAAACSGSSRMGPPKPVAAAPAQLAKAPRAEPEATEPKAPAPEAPKPKLKPDASDLHVVHADGDQLLRTDLQTGESTPLEVGKVVTAKQDGEGHWWVVRAQGDTHALVRIPVGFKLGELQVVVDDVPGDSGHYALHFPDTSELKMTALSAVRQATKQCGGWIDPSWLCDEAMGWTERSTWTWKPTATQWKALGLASPTPAKRSKVTRGPMPSPFSRVPCTCYGERYAKCGSTTPIGDSGWTLMLTSVECGDLPHHGCVVEAADKGAYSAFSSVFSDVAFSLDLRWIQRARVDPGEGPFGSCGPLYVTPDGDWIGNGDGTFCALDDGGVCTPALKGDYLGTTGEAPQVIQLP